MSSDVVVSGRRRDAKYRDETADLIIISSDNVRFYVQSFYMLAASSVFRDMIQSCTSTPAEVQLTDETIERSGPIRLLLDLVCTGHLAKIAYARAGTASNIFALISLCEKYDCAAALHVIKLSVSQPLDRDDDGSAFRFFVACAVDDLDTAHRLVPVVADVTWSAALAEGPVGFIKGASCLDVTGMSTQWQDRMTPKYFQALLRASRLRLREPKGTWQQVADDFKKQVRLQEANPAPAPM